MVADGEFESASSLASNVSGDVIDRACGCIGVKNGGGSTADHLDPVQGLIKAKDLVGVQISESGVVLNR